MRPPPRPMLHLLLVLAIQACSCSRTPGREAAERIARARQLEESGETAAAGRLYGEALELDPCSGEALLRLGLQDYIGGDFPGAAERFQACVQCNPEHLHCWERLAWTCEKLGLHEDAARAYRQANRIEPGRAFMDGEGQALLRAGRLEEAARIFLEIRAKHPEDHRCVYFLANVRRRQGNVTEARALYEKAIEMRPVLVEAYQNLASILFEEARYAEAAALMERTFEAVPLDAPFDPELRYNIGICYLKAGDRERAGEHLRRYLELAPRGEQAGVVTRLLEAMMADEPKSTGEERS